MQAQSHTGPIITGVIQRLDSLIHTSVVDVS